MNAATVYPPTDHKCPILDYTYSFSLMPKEDLSALVPRLSHDSISKGVLGRLQFYVNYAKRILLLRGFSFPQTNPDILWSLVHSIETFKTI